MAVPRGGQVAAPIVEALVGKAVRDDCGYDGIGEIPHVLENVRVDAMTETDGVLKGDLDEVG